MRNLMVRALVGTCALAAFAAGDALAGTIRFEGIAPSSSPWEQHDKDVTRTIDDFDVHVEYGFYVDSGHVGIVNDLFPDNGTDWLLLNGQPEGTNPFGGPVTITHAAGSAFSATSFDATEWYRNHPGGRTIDVTGTTTDGSTVTTSFTTATRSTGTQPVFQTFVFGTGWDALVSLEIDAPTVRGRQVMALDDLVVTPIPLPVGVWPAILVLGGLLVARGLRR